MSTRYIPENNRGLSTMFQLHNGKFQLTEGVEKCQDNIRMLVLFGGWFRVLLPDYCVNLYWMIQKPIAWVHTFKTAFLGRFIYAATKYAPYIKIGALDVAYDTTSPAGRREVTLGISYMYNLDKTDEVNIYTQKLN